MKQKIERLPRATTAISSGLSRLFEVPRPAGWQVGSARFKYAEFEDDRGVDATRYGDWEYSGRCTDF